MKYNLGARVRIVQFDHPKFVGRVGEVTDVLESSLTEEPMYTVRLDGTDHFLPLQFAESALEGEGEDGFPYCFEESTEDDTLYISLIKHPDTADEELMAQAYAKLKYPGVLGYVQAYSFAIKQLYKKLGGKF